jgi:hypothetical protein
MLRTLLVLAAVGALATTFVSTATAEPGLPPPGGTTVGQSVKPDLVITLTNGMFTVTNVRCGMFVPGCYGGAGQRSSGAFHVDFDGRRESICIPFGCWPPIYWTQRWDVWSLAPGASASFAFAPFNDDGCIGFLAVADPTGRVDESDELNNNSSWVRC